MGWRNSVIAVVLLFVAPSTYVDADIYRWDNGVVIPGTEGIEPTAGFELWCGAYGGELVLDYADLARLDLHTAVLDHCQLENARFTQANLTGVNFHWANLTGADFTDAMIQEATFAHPPFITKEQLYSTASYKAKSLLGVRLLGSPGYTDMSEWNFSGQDLSRALFVGEEDLYWGVISLANANFTNAKLTETVFSTRHGSFEGVILQGADLRGSIDGNLVGRGAILPNGHLVSQHLTSGQTQVVRDYDGDKARGQVAIPLTIEGQWILDPGGILRIVADSDDWDSLILFQPGIRVQLGGTLELTFSDGTDVASQVGRTLHIFDWTGVNPAGLFQVASPYAWDLAQLYTTGNVTLLSVLIGDMNGDGSIDAADAGIMFGNWSNSGQGDLNGDGIVDAADAGMMFEKWTGDSVAVPEPSSLLMGAVGAVLLRRRSHRVFRSDTSQGFLS